MALPEIPLDPPHRDVQLPIHDQNSSEHFQAVVVAGMVNTDTAWADWRTGSTVVQEVCRLMFDMGYSSEPSSSVHIGDFDLPLPMSNEYKDVAAGGQAHRAVSLRWNPHFLATMAGGGGSETGGEGVGCATPPA